MQAGVVYVVYGEMARAAAVESITSLRRWHDWPVIVVGDQPIDGTEWRTCPRADAGGRWAKLSIDLLSPWAETLYLDADCRVHGDLSAGFQILADGWDLAMSYSSRQGSDVMGHAPVDDRETTFDALGCRDVLGLQAGMMLVAWNDRTRALWAAWREEWERFGGQDQTALLRAMARAPVRVWLLGREWNGGGLVEHRFGAAR